MVNAGVVVEVYRIAPLKTRTTPTHLARGSFEFIAERPLLHTEYREMAAMPFSSPSRRD